MQDGTCRSIFSQSSNDAVPVGYPQASPGTFVKGWQNRNRLLWAANGIGERAAAVYS